MRQLRLSVFRHWTLLVLGLLSGPVWADSQTDSPTESDESMQSEAEKIRQERLERIRVRRAQRDQEREAARQRQADGVRDPREDDASGPTKHDDWIERLKQTHGVLFGDLLVDPPWIQMTPLILEETLPRVVMPRCMAGLDPFNPTVDGWQIRGARGLEIEESPTLTVLHFAGFQPGDRILSVNAYPVGDTQELRRANWKTRRASTCVYRVQRGAFPVELRLDLQDVDLPGSLVMESLRDGDPGFPSELHGEIDELRRISRMALWVAVAEPGRARPSWHGDAASRQSAPSSELSLWGSESLDDALDWTPRDRLERIDGVAVDVPGDVTPDEWLALMLISETVTLSRETRFQGHLRIELVGEPIPQAEHFIVQNPSLHSFTTALDTRHALMAEESRRFRGAPSLRWMLIDELLNQAEWRPSRTVDGDFLALQIQQVGSELRRLGVAEGDLVVRVNGQSFDDLEALGGVLDGPQSALILEVESTRKLAEGLSMGVRVPSSRRTLELRMDDEAPSVPFSQRLQPSADPSGTELFFGARMVFYFGPSNATHGVRISGVRRNSDWARMGVKNGDVLHAVGDLRLDSYDGLEQLTPWLEQVENGMRFEISLTRRNMARTLQVERSETGGWIELDGAGTAVPK